jgi:diguanylate cyclase (GGDEF)-like protein
MRTFLIIVCGALCVAAIALGDVVTDMRVSLTLFHVLSIAGVAWAAGWRPALIVAVFSLGANLLIDLKAGVHLVDGGFVFAWAIFNRLLAYVSTVLLLEWLRESQRRLKQHAQTDALTGLLNRRAFEEKCEEELRRCRRQSAPLTVAMIDLDGFKAVNDSLGHATGDAVLKLVGELLQQLRSGEVAARLGGDEFAVLFPASSMASAQAAIDRLSRSLEREAGERRWKVSCSVGLSSSNATDSSCEDMVQRADEAMYRHKRARMGVRRPVSVRLVSVG